MTNSTGNIVGYDPGGNGKHGLAVLHVESEIPKTLESHTIDDAESAILKVEETSNLIGFGIDTMTRWSTGESGLRPADRRLRNRYEEASNSVVSPNGMYGSMGINGMSVLIAARKAQRNLLVTETHPKVLYYAMFGEQYDYENDSARMDTQLQDELNTEVETENDHEWDAAVSTLAVLRGRQGRWKNDLHEIEPSDGERLIDPCGETHYFWPE